METSELINKVVTTTQKVTEQNKNIDSAINVLKELTHNQNILLRLENDRAGLTTDDKQYIRGFIDFLEKRKITFGNLEQYLNNLNNLNS